MAAKPSLDLTDFSHQFPSPTMLGEHRGQRSERSLERSESAAKIAQTGKVGN